MNCAWSPQQLRSGGVALRTLSLAEHARLIAIRKELGFRSRPSVPFLERDHPINVSLGHARHAKKVTDSEKKKPK